MPPEKSERYTEDADGHGWTFRRISAVLETRQRGFSTWQMVMPGHFQRFTPNQLRHIADVLEGGR